MKDNKPTIKDAFAGHFLGDFACQNQWMAENKGKCWEVLAYHSLTYTAAFRLIGETNPLRMAILAVSHFIIDTLKARWRIIPHIWMDQALHAIVLQYLYADRHWAKKRTRRD